MVYLENLTVNNFVSCSNDMPENNNVYVPKSVSNKNILLECGCTDQEIEKLPIEDGCIDVYKVLYDKGFRFDVIKGFYKS